MCTLVRDRAYDHCRTCFMNFGAESFEINNGEKSILINPININNNEHIKSLIEKYIDAQATEGLEGFPQHICIQCYNKLQAFNNFCQQAKDNAKKLHELFAGSSSNPQTENIKTESKRITTAESKDTTFSDYEFSQSSSSSDFSSSDIDFNDDEVDIEKALDSLANAESDSDNKNYINTEKCDDEPSQKKRKISFKCNYCSLTFWTIAELDEHVRNKHIDSKRPFRCTLCDKAFSVYSNLERHKKDLHGPKTRSNTTKIKQDYDAMKIKSNSTNMNKDDENEDTTAMEFKCEECNKSFQSQSSINKHMSYKHPQKPSESYVCEHCGITYPIWGSLKCHLKTKHPTEEDLAEREQKRQFFECPHCKKSYQSTYKLNDHIKEKHSEDKPYVCPICGKRNAVKHLFRVHMKTHDIRSKIPCDICGKQISSRYELNEHIKAVHMKLRPFKCQYCEKCFACRKTLRHHEYTHTGEKPYVCNVCGVAYRQRSCLRNHKKTHEQTQFNAVEFMQAPVPADDKLDFITI